VEEEEDEAAGLEPWQTPSAMAEAQIEQVMEVCSITSRQMAQMLLQENGNREEAAISAFFEMGPEDQATFQIVECKAAIFFASPLARRLTGDDSARAGQEVCAASRAAGSAPSRRSRGGRGSAKATASGGASRSPSAARARAGCTRRCSCAGQR
jgi:hypothetical protein